VPRIDVVVETPLPRSMRVRQTEAMFDVPPAEASRLEWHLDAPLDERSWNIGLIVGPSGAGKSTIARQLWPEELARTFDWGAPSVLDDFPATEGIEEIAGICSAVGFNTIPAWRRPFSVLSTGERFRVELARRMLAGGDPIVIDEFTSVVDRQVAKIGSHAVQKWVRKHGKQLVAVTCHQDVEEWLQPDWVIEPSRELFRWRSLQRRPHLSLEIGPVERSAWRMFAPFHYLTASLHRAAWTWGAWVDGRLAAFTSTLTRPVSRGVSRRIVGVPRTVTLPDYQGLGLVFALNETIAAAYVTAGYELRCYPAHPSFVRVFDQSVAWALVKRPGRYSTRVSKTDDFGAMGGRPCAVFRYAGAAMARADAARLLAHWHPRDALRLRSGSGMQASAAEQSASVDPPRR
jgi:hypothetical protein